MAKISIPSVIEPSFKGEGFVSQLELIQALNWYNINKTEKDAAKYLKCEPKIAKNHTTYAWTIRMRERGFVFNEKTEKQIAASKLKFETSITNKFVPDLDSDGNVVPEAAVINLQERITAKTDTFIGELEGMLDEVRKTEKPFAAYDWFLKNEVKPIHANRIAEYYRNRAAKLMEEIKQFPEYYEDLPKAKLKAILAACVAIVQDAERLSSNVSKTRKPRKKKAVSVEKQVAKVNYLKNDNNFKIQSIDPVNIVGADQLWIFNVKTRKLGVYIAADRGGLKVKGSAILNYAENSTSKTLRKPEKTLTTVLDGGKITLRKVMDSINSKAVPLNGRINKDTILLRAVR